MPLLMIEAPTPDALPLAVTSVKVTVPLDVISIPSFELLFDCMRVSVTFLLVLTVKPAVPTAPLIVMSLKVTLLFQLVMLILIGLAKVVVPLIVPRQGRIGHPTQPPFNVKLKFAMFWLVDDDINVGSST